MATRHQCRMISWYTQSLERMLGHMPCRLASRTLNCTQLAILQESLCSRANGPRPNPSLKLSTKGVSLRSSGARPAAHFAPATRRATALTPA